MAENNSGNDYEEIVFYDYIRNDLITQINNIKFAYKHEIFPSSFIYTNDNTRLYIHKFISPNANIIYVLHPKVREILLAKYSEKEYYKIMIAFAELEPGNTLVIDVNPIIKKYVDKRKPNSNSKYNFTVEYKTEINDSNIINYTTLNISRNNAQMNMNTNASANANANALSPKLAPDYNMSSNPPYPNRGEFVFGNSGSEYSNYSTFFYPNTLVSLNADADPSDFLTPPRQRGGYNKKRLSRKKTHKKTKKYISNRSKKFINKKKIKIKNYI